MRYFYSCEQVRRGNFNVQYHPGLECLGDYPPKYHITAHHQNVRSIYLHTNESLLFLLRAPNLSDMRGCVGKTLAGYKHGRPLPMLPRNRSRLPQGPPLNGVPGGGVPSLQVEGAKPVIPAKHTTLARYTRQDSNLLQVEGCQANNN